MKRDRSSRGARTEPGVTAVLPGAKAPTVSAPNRIDGVVIGRIADVGMDGQIKVSYTGASDALPARSIVPVVHSDNGRPAAITFEEGDPQRPILLGLIHQGVAIVGIDSAPEHLIIEAEHELTLRCGKASITLTRDGKLLLRGTYVSSHAKGTNRIKGGSVRMN